jgi:SAM-dependent methyltransferase
MRDYTNIDKYLDKLEADIYPQPQDPGHSRLASQAINHFNTMVDNVESVLDLGCGEGFCQPDFEKFGYEYTGVCLQRDFYNAREKGRNVFQMDFSFLPFEDSSYDLLFSRHSLEHSPFPIITLMEWYRVCKQYLALVLPAPEYWGKVGRNHYFVLERAQWISLFEVTGFDVIFSDAKRKVMIPEHGEEVIEYWFLLEKR